MSYAVFLEDYCGRHLSEKVKSGYKAKIEKLVKAGHSLKGANLYEANLQEAYLQEANLKESIL